MLLLLVLPFLSAHVVLNVDPVYEESLVEDIEIETEDLEFSDMQLSYEEINLNVQTEMEQVVDDSNLSTKSEDPMKSVVYLSYFLVILMLILVSLSVICVKRKKAKEEKMAVADAKNVESRLSLVPKPQNRKFGPTDPNDIGRRKSAF